MSGKLEVNGKSYEIGPASVLMDIRRTLILMDLKSSPDPIRSLLKYSYASLAGSIVGDDVPTFEEFCNAPKSVGDQWYDLAKVENPEWFAPDDRSIEKKEPEPTTSTID